MNKENYEKVKNEYIPYQYKLIDSILAAIDKLEVVDQSSNSFNLWLQSHVVNILFRLLGYKKFIKEVFDEDIIIPEKYNPYIKMAQDYIYLDNNDTLMIYNIKTEDDPKSVLELIENAKKKREKSNDGKN